MYFLSITDPQNWLLAGISMLVVFSILVILVAILNIFSLVSKKQTSTKTVKGSPEQSKGLEKANEEDKAAVATALYLYFEEINNSESRVLTISPYNSAWGAQLNPRL